MKTLLKLTLGLMTSALLIASCNDDDDNTTTEEQVQHSWSLDSSTFRTVSGSTDNTISYTGTASDYFDFRSDGKVYYRIGASAPDTVDYKVVGTNRIVVDGDTSDIELLTNNRFVVSFKDPVNATNYTLSKTYLRR